MLIDQILYVLDLIFKGNVLILSFASCNRLLNPISAFYHHVLSRYLPYKLLFDFLIFISVKPLAYKKTIYEHISLEVRDVFIDRTLAKKDRLDYFKDICLIYNASSVQSELSDFLNSAGCHCDYCCNYYNSVSCIDDSKMLIEYYNILNDENINITNEIKLMIDKSHNCWVKVNNSNSSNVIDDVIMFR